MTPNADYVGHPPRPEDGPDYHADYEAWLQRLAKTYPFVNPEDIASGKWVADDGETEDVSRFDSYLLVFASPDKHRYRQQETS